MEKALLRMAAEPAFLMSMVACAGAASASFWIHGHAVSVKLRR